MKELLVALNYTTINRRQQQQHQRSKEKKKLFHQQHQRVNGLRPVVLGAATGWSWPGSDQAPKGLELSGIWNTAIGSQEKLDFCSSTDAISLWLCCLYFSSLFGCNFADDIYTLLVCFFCWRCLEGIYWSAFPQMQLNTSYEQVVLYLP